MLVQSPAADDVSRNTELARADAKRKSEPSPKLVVDAHVMESVLHVADGKSNGGAACLVEVTSRNLSATQSLGREERDAGR